MIKIAWVFNYITEWKTKIMFLISLCNRLDFVKPKLADIGQLFLFRLIRLLIDNNVVLI